MADNEASREDRQLPASERRIQKAREEGRVARSRDLGHFAVLGAALVGAAAIGPAIARETIAMLRGALTFGRQAAITPQHLPEMLATLGADAFTATLPLVAGLSVVAIAVTMIPGGVVLSTKPVDFDPSRLNPSNGLRRLFSVRGAFDLARLLLLSFALAAIGSWFVATSLAEFAGLAVRPLAQGLSGGASLMGAGLVALVAVLAAVALVDVPFQWFRHRADLKMTHQEARREAKESDGDPMLRGRMRARQREIAGRRMLAAVPGADVVVTNPTHYAVAIRYDESAMGAPRVVAKGADLIAARIRELAAQSGVPLLEAPPLARALYAHVDIDREIPAALYNAVAQVLAWVYQLRHGAGAPGRTPAAPAAIEVPPGLDPAARSGGDAMPGGRP